MRLPADRDLARGPRAAKRTALFFGEAAPDAVALAGGDRMLEALDPDRAGGADGLGRPLPRLACRTALALRMEERVGILATACALELPVPDVRIGSGEPGYVRHLIASCP